MIIRGRLEEISAGTFSQGAHYVEYLKIDNIRHRKLVYSNYIKSFLKISDDIELSIKPKSRFFPYGYVWAIKVNGEIIKDDVAGKGIFQYYLFYAMLIVFAIPAMAVGISMESALLGWITLFALSWLSSLLFIKWRVATIDKYRNALD